MMTHEELDVLTTLKSLQTPVMFFSSPWIQQNIFGISGFLEELFIPAGFVGMEYQGQPPIRAFDLLCGGSSLNTKNSIKVWVQSGNHEDWQFVMGFPRPVKDGDNKEFEKFVDQPGDLWKDIFPRSEPKRFDKPITMQDFSDQARKKIEEILEGPNFHCKTGNYVSIDGDEYFLKIALKEKDMLHSLAERVEARARVKPSAYEKAKVVCPTEHKVGEEFKRYESEHRNLHTKDKQDNCCPAHVLFRKALKDKLEDFEEPNVLRILRRHIINYIQIQELQKAGVVSSFFAVHQWQHLQELHNRGWNNLSRLWSWPKDGTADFIVQYTGVQVAFLFHLYNTFTRWLSGPAVLSTVNFVLRRCPFTSAREMKFVDSAYGAMLCMWTTVFLVRYNQLLNLKTYRWGMEGAEREIVPVRKEFSDEYRGSILDGLQKFAHSLLCLVFIVETIGAAQVISSVSHEAHAHPEESTRGIPNTTVILLAKYAITLNIKVVDLIWTPLSTWLSKKENWRTEPEMKSHMIVKLFAVKFVVFYYPFAHTILIQPYWGKGCDGGEMSGCVSKLRSDLYFFFVCQVLSEAFAVCMTLASVYWSVRSELKSKRAQNHKFTYLELQAKVPEYGEAEQIQDYMQLVLSFGFIAMFGVTCPSMSILCFFVTFPIKRLLAYKISYAHQRVIPRVEEGIGAWRSIMNFIAYIGVTCTCYIVIFVFSIEHMDFASKLLVFILSERALMGLKWVMETFMGTKTVAQLRAEEHNEKVLDKVLNDNDHDKP